MNSHFGRLLRAGVGLLCLVAAGVASAALIDRGGGMIYDDDLKITWLADANLFKAQYANDNTVINQIIAAVPNVGDGLGNHALVADDFYGPLGNMTWWGAMAWAEWLTYGGFDDWRLPSALDADGSGPFGAYDPRSEMGHLFYTEGRLSAGQSIVANPPGYLDDYFINMQSWYYWTGLEREEYPQSAWNFDARSGYLGTYWTKGYYFYSWAVRDGDVAAVPEPSTLMLLGMGLVGLISATQRKRRTY
jgi:hypothetical protein